nr:metallophosphoesterase family protein [Paracoccus sp. PAR01]
MGPSDRGRAGRRRGRRVIRIAVIADPHVHDCGWRPAGSGLDAAIRSFGDTLASTRVFNESIPAFRAALDHAVAEGAKLVLLVGDLTDDGQAPNIAAAVALIGEYRDRHGLRVLATPGNHDFFALHGRPQKKTFLTAEGTPQTLCSSTCYEAATLGMDAALRRMQHLGYRPEPDDLHWESPFGTDPDFAARTYPVPSPDGGTTCPMIDASYLVEPVEGLWVLSIDSNVSVPRDDAQDFTDPAEFHDATDGGWPAVLRHRAHLLPWMRDVAARAKAGGKQLVAFSHYPVLDVLAGTGTDELRVFGATGLARRTPPSVVAEAVAATGVPLHFSGHLHVNDTAFHPHVGGGLFNIAVPSPVGFCPAMKIVDLDGDLVAIRSLPLAQVPGHDLAFAAYRAEAGTSIGPAMDAADHGAFLDHHLVELVRGRYVPREWPADMAEFVDSARIDDLLALLGVTLTDAPDLTMWQLVEDWYRLRKAGALAEGYVAPERLDFYQRLCDRLPQGGKDSLAGRFLALLRILRGYLGRLPNGDFTLDLRDLSVRGS